MPLKGPNGQTFESFESCVTAIQDDEDVDREEAQKICGSFEEVDKDVKDNDTKIKILDRLTKFLYGDHGQDEAEQEFKGDSLAGLLNEAVNTATSVRQSREDIIQKITKKSDSTAASVKNAINGNVECPSEDIVNAAGDVLPIDKNTLMLAGRGDGCDYSVMKDEKQEKEFTATFDIAKTNDEKRLVGGMALKADRPDSDGDIFPDDVVEKLAHNFMVKSQQMGLDHEVAVDDVALVESWTAKTDFKWDGTQVEKGDWLAVSKVFDDEIWKEVKKGTFNSFSIEGVAVKREIDE